MAPLHPLEKSLRQAHDKDHYTALYSRLPSHPAHSLLHKFCLHHVLYPHSLHTHQHQKYYDTPCSNEYLSSMWKTRYRKPPPPHSALKADAIPTSMPSFSQSPAMRQTHQPLFPIQQMDNVESYHSYL